MGLSVVAPAPVIAAREPHEVMLKAVSKSAISITGDVRLMLNAGGTIRKIVFANGRSLTLSGMFGEGAYHVKPPANPVLLHGNTLCPKHVVATTVYYAGGIHGSQSFTITSGGRHPVTCGMFDYFSNTFF